MDATGKPDSLATWNDGASKSQILDFVARVTRQGGPDFVPPAERIAVFDNDGTLWCEQPMQVQVFSLIARVKELAEKDATVKERQPFKALLELDLKTLMGLGKQALLELVFTTHSGMKEEEFDPMHASGWRSRSIPSSGGCSSSAHSSHSLSCSISCVAHRSELQLFQYLGAFLCVPMRRGHFLHRRATDQRQRRDNRDKEFVHLDSRGGAT